MRKILLGLALLMTTVSYSYAGTIYTVPYTTDADVTIENLNNNREVLTDALNSIDGTRIQVETISADALTDNANPEKRSYYSLN